MVWKNCASQLAITLQRKVLTAAIVYAISVIAHLTSPVGHGTEIPTHSAWITGPQVHHDASATFRNALTSAPSSFPSMPQRIW